MLSKIMLETKRLILRQFETDDVSELLRHRSDAEIMKYLGGTQNRATVKKRIKLYADFYQKHGYGFCAMIWRETGQFIGVGGIQISATSGETEVGYTVDKEFWGRGIATECTIACLDYGFEKLELNKIVALTHPENIGSKRVLEKAGMSLEKETENMGETWLQYMVTKDKYARI
jgi:ribosomal-protein-alanine N-acetyltransferase